MVRKETERWGVFKISFGIRPDFLYFCLPKMVAIAQLVRASDCGSEGRGFEPHWLPGFKASHQEAFFYAAIHQKLVLKAYKD